ncbi:hypothetical protein BDV59DRAFT_187578 [Aspergillus ambiguus]|uniref:uncharacterized protein n=1 Tax=Aspergillus ambiguus TaxID=176160 RepID=UPI003CCCDE96
MATHDDIPQSPQDALRIRQALTTYLRSHIVFADEDHDLRSPRIPSHLSLCVPHNAVVDVKRPPPELTGLRQEYLEALRANLSARRDYQSVCEKTSNAGRLSSGSGESSSAAKSSLELQAYLRLLRDRRRHAKLQVFQHYLQEIQARNPTHVEDFDTRESRGEPLVSPSDREDGVHGDAGEKRENSVEELVHKLERAVIRAQAQLKSEKKLLDELKARQAPAGEEVTPAVKGAALQRTRDELVHWVEEKLVSEGDGEEPPLQDVPAEEIEESARLLEDQKVQVAEQYAAYVDARKRLLDAASRACQPITVAPARSPDRAVEPGKLETDETVSLDPTGVLSFTSEILLPLSKSQRTLALQKSYLAGMLAKEKSATLRVLNRLSDESHLLPEYPLLARQPRFQHATSALRSRPNAIPTEPTEPDKVVRLAEAWAFASEAARTTEGEYVEQKATEGGETAEEAEHVLREVYRLINQDLEEALRDDAGNEPEGDIWASEARSTRPVGKPVRSRRSQGPWSGIDGRVGIDRG